MSQRDTRSLVLGCLSLLVASACGSAAEVDTLRIMVDGVQRDLLVYVPEAALEAEPAALRPAVIMIHGTADTGLTVLNHSGWKDVADEEGVVVAFPTALVHCHKQDKNLDGDFADDEEVVVATKWAAGELGTAVMPLCTRDELAFLSREKRALADHPLADDLAFFDAQVDLLTKYYAVDPNRIYVAGHSNGAQMTVTLATKRSERFAAAAPHAGTLFPLYDPNGAPPTRRMKVFESVGDRDQIFTRVLKVDRLPMDGGLREELPELYVNFVLPMLWLGNLIDDFDFRAQTLDGKAVSTFEYAKSNGGDAGHFELMIIGGGMKHIYPNGENYPVHLARAVWQRFAAERLG